MPAAALHRLAAGAAPDGHVHLQVLLTWAQTGAAAQVTDAVLVALLAAYAWAAHRPGRRRSPCRGSPAPASPPWPWRRTAALAAGLAAVFAAVGSGLAAYDEVNPTAHVVQHVLLMSVAPPLLVASRPVTLVLQRSPRRLKVALLRLVGSRPMGALAGPAAWLAMPALMAAFFLTPLYAAGDRHVVLHDALHGAFLLAGYLAWHAVLGVDAVGGHRGHGWRLVTVLVSMTLEAAVGAAMVLARHPLGPSVTLAATRRAGQALWMLSMLSCGVATALVLRQWIAADERRVRRWEQRQPPAGTAGPAPAPAPASAAAAVGAVPRAGI